MKAFTEQRCLECEQLFQPIAWLKWRVNGYCCKLCEKTRDARLAELTLKLGLKPLAEADVVSGRILPP